MATVKETIQKLLNMPMDAQVVYQPTDPSVDAEFEFAEGGTVTAQSSPENEEITEVRFPIDEIPVEVA